MHIHIIRKTIAITTTAAAAAGADTQERQRFYQDRLMTETEKRILKRPFLMQVFGFRFRRLPLSAYRHAEALPREEPGRATINTC
eukprot:COSAG06_NODE_50173_length_320_cov_1.058824_1_plen_85_part_00